MDYLPPYSTTTVPCALYEMAEPATISPRGGPVLRLLGSGSIRSVEVRPHPRGGGYIGDVRIQRAGAVMSGNLATYRFGRGWQSSIRDNTGHWNPTQGGFRETVGIGTRVVKLGDGLAIAPFRVPLFQHSGDDGFDFTENESMARDDFPNDRGRDADKLPGERSQAGEVCSEMSFRGYYAPLPVAIPAFEHRFYYAFDQPAGSLKQFRTTARDLAGQPVFDPALVQPGFSKLEPSKITLSYGVRMQDLPGWTFTHYTGMYGDLRPVPKSPAGQENRDRLEVPVDLTTEVPLAIMATSANGGTAIGLYAPGKLNKDAVPGATSERVTKTRFVFARDSGALAMIYRAEIDGLHLGEQIYGHVVVLFGSVNEIRQQVQFLTW